MKSGELFDKRKFPQLTGDAEKDIESLRRWAFEITDAFEQEIIKLSDKLSELSEKQTQSETAETA